MPVLLVLAWAAQAVHDPSPSVALYVARGQTEHAVAPVPWYPGRHRQADALTLPVELVLACAAQGRHDDPLSGTGLYVANGHMLHIGPTDPATHAQSYRCCLAVPVVLVFAGHSEHDVASPVLGLYWA